LVVAVVVGVVLRLALSLVVVPVGILSAFATALLVVGVRFFVLTFGVILLVLRLPLFLVRLIHLLTVLLL